MEWTKLHTIILVAVVLLIFIFMMNGEHMTNFTLTRIAYDYPNPTLFKYGGRIKNELGWSPKGYFLDNRLKYGQGVAPELHGVPAFESNMSNDQDLDTILPKIISPSANSDLERQSRSEPVFSTDGYYF